MSGPSSSNRIRLVVGGILAVGWTIALAVYLSAATVQEDPDISIWEQSKSYQRQLEMIGGKSAVVGSELNDWIASLWHGKGLAYTIATATVVVAFACYAWDRTRPDSTAR
jgi:hypothetical protein